MTRMQRLAHDLEQVRVQLAGCSVAALGRTADPAKPGDYGYSASYQDVLTLRWERDALEAKLNSNECGRGHKTLPLVLWDCPACHDQTRGERDKALAALLDAGKQLTAANALGARLAERYFNQRGSRPIGEDEAASRALGWLEETK